MKKSFCEYLQESRQITRANELLEDLASYNNGRRRLAKPEWDLLYTEYADQYEQQALSPEEALSELKSFQYNGFY